MLAERPGLEFWGQGVAWPGHAMFKNFSGIPANQMREYPVEEEFQLGMGIGYTMDEDDPPVVSLFPRCDFLLRAADALVNHLDKIAVMSRWDFQPKVIIRTRVGNKAPLDAGPQHTQNHTAAFRLMLANVEVAEITRPEEILPTYQAAMDRTRSTLVVENLG